MLSTFPAFLQYMVSSALLLIIALAIYLKATPYNEIKSIKEGNIAAAIAFAGTILGMSIAMSSVIFHSTTWLDKIVWVSISLIVQLAIWFGINLCFKNLQHSIDVDKSVSHAILLASISTAAGIIQAACLSY